MTAQSDTGVVSAFLDKFRETSDETTQLLGTSGKLVAIWWAGASNLDDTTGLLIPDFNKIVKKGGGFSSQIQDLKKLGAVENGDKRGEWYIPKKLVRKMRKLLGEDVADEPDTPKTTATRGRPGPKPGGKKAAAADAETPLNKLKGLVHRLEEIDATRAQLDTERTQIVATIASVAAALKT